MEQKKIDIAELLIDAPKGTLLYSPICGEVELLQSSNADGYIEVKDSRDEVLEFFRDGRYDMFGESLLFPSREVHDWGLFRVKWADGVNARQALIEYGGIDDGEIVKNSTEYYYIDSVTKIIESLDGLFDAEKAYVLATGTKLKPKEEQPKFKVGDVIKSNTGLIGMIDCKAITGDYIATDGQNECAIIKATATLATPEEITKWNKEVLEPNHLHYSKSKRKIIHWFLPFDKVIVKEEKETHWRADFFSNKEDEWYCCMSGNYEHCLPYNDKTAKLIGTADDYEED